MRAKSYLWRGALVGFAVAALVAIAGLTVAHANGVVAWTGNGSDAARCTDRPDNTLSHWIFTTGGNDSVTSATLTVDGVEYPMTQNGAGSWSADVPGGVPSSAFVTFEGDLGKGNAVVTISCLGTGSTPPPSTPPPTTPPPTTPPPTTPPTSVPPTSRPPQGPSWSPTWSPTWTPTHVGPGGGPGNHPLAFTGLSDAGQKITAAGLLLVAGLTSLWFARKRAGRV